MESYSGSIHNTEFGWVARYQSVRMWQPPGAPGVFGVTYKDDVNEETALVPSDSMDYIEGRRATFSIKVNDEDSKLLPFGTYACVEKYIDNPPYVSDDFQIGPGGAFENTEQVQSENVRTVPDVKLWLTERTSVNMSFDIKYRIEKSGLISCYVPEFDLVFSCTGVEEIPRHAKAMISTFVEYYAHPENGHDNG